MAETTELNLEKMQLAVLIDADNISSKYAATIFEELENYGLSTYRRIYGNWSKSNGWTEGILLEHSIMPVQQFSYTTGKNATDMAMVIDAMDILYKNKVQGFCLVTSDSDFTRLAMRLREENMFVLGMGESKTPQALTRACNKFIHLNLVAEQNKSAGETESSADDQNVTSIAEVKQVILTLINQDDEGLVDLAQIGNRLNEKFSDFDVRNYGYFKLSTFIGEKISDIQVVKIDNQLYAKRQSSLTKEELEREICRMIEKSGGVIDNLSTLNDELHKRYRQLDLKEFGYSRISSFLRSLKSVTVRENKVTLKK
ncbi:MAG: NYN domain-containing protein [Eubacterium sp.]|nr:NYN domain-containing protein [Eubacterium sp.]MCM1216070.1 NYN domain-containing protein [Lachnospiraceae bacterium]MCM1239821.1 NYN domain-containing protein [Lachnospiraceae bacterium]MCM1343705.1 NYN domain-containing protein [Muribaculaceae bacterium]MCM1410195.1 NYN domain-containing protein [Lachnospiraceae bacterium]